MSLEKVRSIAGLGTGLLIIRFAAAHSLGGGTSLRRKLEAAHVPDQLLAYVITAWHFGGGAILVAGLIVLAMFAQRVRGRSASMLPVAIIAVAYVVFGVYATFAFGPSPFLVAFILPGALLLFALPQSAGKSAGFPIGAKSNDPAQQPAK